MNSNQITKITIKGFKSIKECTLDLTMLNVLIGSNGVGKTNFISLFKMLQSMFDGEFQKHVSKQGGADAILHFGSKTTEKIYCEVKFGKNGYSFKLEPTSDGKLMFGAEWFDWFPNQEEGSVSPRIGSGHLESIYNKGSNTGLDKYIIPVLKNKPWKVYHFHDTSETAYVKKEHGINDNIELATDARNLAAFLYRLKQTEEKSYERIVKTIRLVAPFFDDFILRPNPLNPENIRLEWKNINSEIPFTASQLSDGTLRFMCLATLLLQPEHLMSDTILIDEPELGLHPYAITVLASLFQSASIKKQLIISTQSVELLNEFKAEDVVVVDRENSSSVFKRLDEESLKVWLEDDYSIGELWKKNILGGRP